MRWYCASFGPDETACSLSSTSGARREVPTLAAFAAVSWKLSPWKRWHDKALETDLATSTLPATEIGAMRRITNFDGLILSSDEGSGLFWLPMRNRLRCLWMTGRIVGHCT